jgi:hypothetical protein
MKMAEAAIETIARIKATMLPSEGLAREFWEIVEMCWVMKTGEWIAFCALSQTVIARVVIAKSCGLPSYNKVCC